MQAMQFERIEGRSLLPWGNGYRHRQPQMVVGHKTDLYMAWLHVTSGISLT